MCGIAGSTAATPELMQTMVARLAHRGPDGNGCWVDPDSGLGLAHARLAIIGLGPAGAQPMMSPCGRWVITFNGEIYNYRALRHEMEGKGETFSSNSDTEVLLRMLARDGLNALDGLVGMFAFALWDRQEGELLLVRDRLGKKPLVYAPLADGGLAFASEIDSLRSHPGLDLSVDRQALSDYLACLYVPAPRTMHTGIRKLPPGHWLRWRVGKIETGQWWRPRVHGERTPTVDEAVEELLPLLRQAVAARLVADVEVGCFLSGGIDSSVIAALMAREAKAAGLPPPRTFTMVFNQAAYDEREDARAVADHIGTRHTELPASAECTGYLDDMVRHFGEPFGNPTALLIRDLSHLARQHVSVALAGDGGDEVFAGYPRYQGGLLAAWYRRMVPGLLRRGIVAPLAQAIPESTSGRHALRRAREFLTAANLPDAEMYAAWVEYFDPAERQALLGLERQPSRPLADIYRSSSSDPLDAMQETDLLSFLPGNLLAYGDAMSMACALELRLPLIDHRLVETVGRMAPQLRFANGKKTLLRAVARRLLPSHIVDRPKRGFNPPMGLWLKHDLKNVVRDRLTPDFAHAMGMEWAAVARLLAEQNAGRRDVSLKVWSLLVLDAWRRGLKVAT